MSKKLTLAALSSTLALLALSAHAQPAPEGDMPPPPPPHEEGAAPEGGKEPMGERKGMRKHKGKHPNFLFKNMDKDGDGKVTRAEHDEFIGERFKETDANNDNSITEDEMKAYGEKKRAERMQKMIEERKAIMEKQPADTAKPASEKK